MKLKSDFHMHTYFSKDSNMSPETLIKTAMKSGLDVIAVTDHNEIEGARIVKRMAERLTKGRLFVIVGEEVNTGEGEIITLGIKEKIEKIFAALKK